MATATQPAIRYSPQIDEAIGTIDFWDERKQFGTVVIDSNPTQNFHLRPGCFHTSDQPYIAAGRVIRFSCIGGAEIGDGKKPRVSKAILLHK